MNGEESTTAIFELFDSTLAEMTPELLGLWQIQPRPVEITFDLSTQPIADVPLWRSNFPADLKQTNKLLTSYEERLKTSQAALSTIPDRIERLITQTDSRMTDDVAFDVSSMEQPLAQPEQALLTTLQELQGVRQPQSLDVDFSVGQELPGGWRQSYEQFQAFTKRAIAVIANYAWVETQIQGKTFARTAVSWKGDVNTIWIDGIHVEQRILHQRSLALALASRNALLQTFTMAVQLALKLSISLSLPGGAILALPAVWQFINQVINQFQQGKEYI